MVKSEVLTDLDNLAENIGKYLGIAEGIEQKGYMDGILNNAYQSALEEFHKVAATSARPQRFTHMYEYGVAGITRGPKKFLDPTQQAARLWIDVMAGGGGRKVITFQYRDALQPNPPHTTKDTGVAQDELDQLAVNNGKEYIFHKRAYVFEEGVEVNIFPRDAKVLFVPLGPSGLTGSERDNDRGFTFVKHLKQNPGEQTDSKGAFSNFFFTWWSTAGAAQMAAGMDTQVMQHIAEEEKTMKAKGAMKPALAINTKATSEAAKKKTRKQFEIKAQRETGLIEKIL